MALINITGDFDIVLLERHFINGQVEEQVYLNWKDRKITNEEFYYAIEVNDTIDSETIEEYTVANAIVHV